MGGFMKKQTQKDSVDIIASRTHPTINDWLFSIEPTEYERDDFIPTLVPEAIPKV